VRKGTRYLWKVKRRHRSRHGSAGRDDDTEVFRPRILTDEMEIKDTRALRRHRSKQPLLARTIFIILMRDRRIELGTTQRGCNAKAQSPLRRRTRNAIRSEEGGRGRRSSQSHQRNRPLGGEVE
jgi:hypothetical protein